MHSFAANLASSVCPLLPFAQTTYNTRAHWLNMAGEFLIASCSGSYPVVIAYKYNNFVHFRDVVCKLQCHVTRLLLGYKINLLGSLAPTCWHKFSHSGIIIVPHSLTAQLSFKFVEFAIFFFQLLTVHPGSQLLLRNSNQFSFRVMNFLQTMAVFGATAWITT